MTESNRFEVLAAEFDFSDRKQNFLMRQEVIFFWLALPGWTLKIKSVARLKVANWSLSNYV